MSKKLTDKQKKRFVDKHLTEIYDQLVINCKKTCGAGYDQWGDDLLAVALEFFLNKPLEVQYESCLNNKAENFVTFIMGFQLKSSTSRFWHVYRKHKSSHRELYIGTMDYSSEKNSDYHDDAMYCIKQAISKLNPYEKMLIEDKVLTGMRWVEIANRYDIPYSSLSNELQKVLKKLKKQCIHLR